MAKENKKIDTGDKILDPEKITSKQRVQLARRGRAERIGGLGTGTKGVGTGLRQDISSILGAAARTVADNPLVPVVNPQKFRGMKLDPRTMGGKSYQTFAELEQDISQGSRPPSQTEPSDYVPLPPPGVVESPAPSPAPGDDGSDLTVAPPVDPTAPYDPNTDQGLYQGPIDGQPMRDDKGVDTGTGSYGREGDQSISQAADEYYGRTGGGTGRGEDAAAAMQAQNMATEDQKRFGSQLTEAAGLGPKDVLTDVAKGAIAGGVPGAVMGVMSGFMSPLGIVNIANKIGGVVRSNMQAGDIIDTFTDQGIMQHATDPSKVKQAAQQAASQGGLLQSFARDALSSDPRTDSTSQLAEMAARKEVASQYGYELQPGDAAYKDVMEKPTPSLAESLKTAIIGGPAPKAPEQTETTPAPEVDKTAQLRESLVNRMTASQQKADELQARYNSMSEKMRDNSGGVLSEQVAKARREANEARMELQRLEGSGPGIQTDGRGNYTGGSGGNTGVSGASAQVNYGGFDPSHPAAQGMRGRYGGGFGSGRGSQGSGGGFGGYGEGGGIGGR